MQKREETLLLFLLDYRERRYKCEYNVSQGRWGSQRRYCICWCFRHELCPRLAVHTLRLPRRGGGWHCWRRSRSSDQHLERLHWPSPEVETKDVNRLQIWEETRKVPLRKQKVDITTVFYEILWSVFKMVIVDSEEIREREIYNKDVGVGEVWSEEECGAVFWIYF